MVDFFIVSTRSRKAGVMEVYPTFLMGKKSDLMIRGGDFYAVWIEEANLWSTDEDDVIRLVDRELDRYADELRQKVDDKIVVLHMWNSESGMIDAWHKYCQKQQRDSYHMLDEKLIFSNDTTCKTDYASKKLSYPLEKGECPGYEKLISTLYSEEERHKIEWAIGAIVTGDSKTIQKFMVLYGAAGTGKSTILHIIQQLFEGYYATFDAKALGSANSSFALEAFKTNPLVAIQHDGDLSKIEDNTRLNSLVSHELMTVNEKFKSTYSNRFKCFLFMGTNKPVKITDAKSGLIRRLIDVSPSGNKLPADEYNEAFDKIPFELGAIAWHCREVYLESKSEYEGYVPTSMLGATNDFYNFVIDSYSIFKKQDGVTLKAAWEMYNTYCSEAKVPYPLSQRMFREELRNYFWELEEKYSLADGQQVRNYYRGFREDRFENDRKESTPKQNDIYTIEFKEQPSIFDKECVNCPAQYATPDETPQKSWSKVKTTLEAINTSRLHYVKVPLNHIVIDFDIKNPDGTKSYEKNLEAASKWPKTYAELSKSGAGIHLHYLYSGDPTTLSRVYGESIEIKVFVGDSALRRKLTKCNDLPIATISSGLPLKGEKMVNLEVTMNERALRTIIKKNLNKEYHPGTKPSIDFIFKTLDDAYKSGMHYDVRDMKEAVIAFASQSTNQAKYCLKLVPKMHFNSDDVSDPVLNDDKPMIFYDIEVFPNLLLVNWKIAGSKEPVVRMINPTPQMIEDLIKFRLVGFNCRRYDNHILYARLLGWSNEEIYDLSQRIISGDRKAFFGEAYNISYTDIYDFASAGNKKSLKKLEIEMGIHHEELGLPWDQPVPENLWTKVAEYCDNDVIATEAAFNYLSADWTARQILADLAGMTVNDTTNSLTTKIIFGGNREPHDEFCYRDLSKPVNDISDPMLGFLRDVCPDMMRGTHDGHGTGPKSILPYFPGYKYEAGISTYRGEKVSEGGYVYAEPGMHVMVALLDVSSMHPHSTIAEVLFGVRYTTAYRDIVEGRVSIKHEAWDEVDHMLDGKLRPYIQKVKNGEMTSGQLANALKTAINSVYGLTAAGFDNPFRDPRNKDNIVAKRGALFMVDLKHAVQERGFTVAHIKTDSIKIPNATPEIIDFVMEFGKKYGYTFEHEATYEKMCLVNNSVYIAKYLSPEMCEKKYGYAPKDNKKHADKPWTATGTQFAVPYVFKTLFSKEKVDDNDMREVFSTSTALYLDMNESLPDVTNEEADMKKLESKYKKGKLSDVSFEESCKPLAEVIHGGHDYHFVGRVGEFCPVKPGKGGGVLVREKDGKYYAASGTTGYRWLEAETLMKNSGSNVTVIDSETGKQKDVAGMQLISGNENIIDRSYYDALVDAAVESISKYGDFEWFVSDEPPIDIPEFMNVPEGGPDELPFVV